MALRIMFSIASRKSSLSPANRHVSARSMETLRLRAVASKSASDTMLSTKSANSMMSRFGEGFAARQADEAVDQGVQPIRFLVDPVERTCDAGRGRVAGVVDGQVEP